MYKFPYGKCRFRRSRTGRQDGRQQPGGLRLAEVVAADIACRGTGKLLVEDAALDWLQAAPRQAGTPLIVRSAYRSPKRNKGVGARSTRRAPCSKLPCRTTTELRSRRTPSPSRRRTYGRPAKSRTAKGCGRGLLALQWARTAIHAGTVGTSILLFLILPARRRRGADAGADKADAGHRRRWNARLAEVAAAFTRVPLRRGSPVVQSRPLINQGGGAAMVSVTRVPGCRRS